MFAAAERRRQSSFRIPQLEDMSGYQKPEDMSRYQNWKTCPDTRVGRHVQIPELEDMSGYQIWKTCPDTRAGRHV